MGVLRLLLLLGLLANWQHIEVRLPDHNLIDDTSDQWRIRLEPGGGDFVGKDTPPYYDQG